MTNSTELANKFINGNSSENDIKIFNSLHSNLKLNFLNVISQTEVTFEIYNRLETSLHLSSKLNDELLYNWLQISLRNNIKEAIPHAVKFVGRVGRIRYLRPIYKALAQIDRETALKTLEINR